MGRTAGQNNNMVNATDFRIGDVVKLVSQDLAANHVGVVTHVLPKSNTVNVQWSWGNKSEAPDTLIKVPKDWYPPTVSKDTSYSTWEADKSEKMFGKLPSNRIASKVALSYLEKIAEGSDLANKMIEELEAFNNTRAWRHGNSIFCDTLKYPRGMLKFIEDKFEIKGIVRHEEHNPEVLSGDASTNLEFGGRKTICNVIEFPLPKWYIS